MQQTRDKHTQRQGIDRLLNLGREPDGGANKAEIEQHRGERGHAETPVGIENAAGESGHGYQEQVRKGNPDQIGGQGQFAGVTGETGGKDHGHHRGGKNGEGCQQQQGAAQNPRHSINQGPHRSPAALFPGLRKDRDEGLCKCAFSEQSPKEIGNLESDKEGVCVAGRTDEVGEHHIPDQTQNPGDHGGTTDNGAGVQQAPFSLLRQVGTLLRCQSCSHCPRTASPCRASHCSAIRVWPLLISLASSMANACCRGMP